MTLVVSALAKSGRKKRSQTMDKLESEILKHAQALAALLRRHKQTAYKRKHKFGDVFNVHIDEIWNQRDSKALDAFENYLNEINGVQRLPF